MAFVRDNEMRTNGKMGDRRKSWGDDFDRSSPGPHGKNRGFQGNDRSGWKMNGAGGDRRKSWSDDFDRSSPDPHGKNRGFRGNGRSGWKTDDAGGDSRNFNGPKRGGFRKQQGGRSHEYNMDKDPGEFRNSRRVIER
ncbi:hypothetical protein OIU79_023485 [Salix purpurea]|uniref:Uncharacterized protein n=1 Tax=Salix purpurea TaxID=77065 RepID=A0A9Q0W8W6_SALPP|nr:hypothetical protein OIU79_023485 [Salix purpurea]